MTRAGLALLALCAAAFGVAAASQPARVNDAAITADGYPAKLSDYGFFTDLARRTPAARVVGYDLETALFSDYTAKQRFIYVPAGAQAKYDANAAFDFPVGSALIKTFGYGAGTAFKPIETRLLLRRASGWVAIPYVWNAEGTDAVVKRAGARLPVSFTDPSGRARHISYAVPNQNQCKDCHALAGQIAPIGPKARYLNHHGQLQALVKAGLLDRAPANAPRVARWDDKKAPLDAARAPISKSTARIATIRRGRRPTPACSSNSTAPTRSHSASASARSRQDAGAAGATSRLRRAMPKARSSSTACAAPTPASPCPNSAAPRRTTKGSRCSANGSKRSPRVRLRSATPKTAPARSPTRPPISEYPVDGWPGGGAGWCGNRFSFAETAKDSNARRSTSFTG
ncbi:hypothetical protein LRS12_03675 [Sphingomonas sp. J344]|uniref:hypothetical protein n=1 Tax=Sphingomonas sp. J344 TaxID=2898434 RepID=UPI002151834A|nr:hypothetical protein [Sphingomonas sp. J344]MCR5869926.1 hypothetical protein [Sphingomonas sp. J344]